MILVGRHEDWIHAQIYEETRRDNAVLDEEHDSIASIVCRPLMKALQRALPDHHDDLVCEGRQLVDLRPFRPLQRRGEQDTATTTAEDSGFVPLAVWTLPLNVQVRNGWMPPSLPAGYSQDWQFFSWDETRDQDSWDDASPPAPASQHSALRSFREQVLQTGPSRDETKAIRLEGKLSESGGMHRKFHQTLRVHLPQTGPSLRATADILVFLPPDLFINIEEAIEMPNDSPLTAYRVLDIPPGRVIDQEEPSFVSPSHGVMIQIDFSAQEEWVTVNWDLLLHTRYPKPLAQGDFSLLALMPPVVWSLRVRDDDDDAVVADLTCPWVAAEATPHYTWVAAGRREDLVPVLAVTTVVALAGSAVMLRALAVATRPSRNH